MLARARVHWAAYRTRGHGTFVEDEDVISAVAGTIDRVNKLVSVRALRSRCGARLATRSGLKRVVDIILKWAI